MIAGLYYRRVAEVRMRVASLMLLTLVVSAVPPFVLAQSETKPQPPVIHIQDGGTSGRMESIFIPPLVGAPFSLTLVTEWSRPLGNGGTFTLANRRRIVRDGQGRIYQERWLLVPKGSKIESRMDVFQITDPMQHTWLNCGVREKVCELLPYGLVPDMVYKPSIGTTGPLPNGSGFRQHEDLGLSNSNGVDTTGYRETTTPQPWRTRKRSAHGDHTGILVLLPAWNQPYLESRRSAEREAILRGDGVDNVRAGSKVLRAA